MAHFAEETWADYVRGFSSIDAMRELASHLANQCPECQKAGVLWGRVQMFAAGETQYAAPADLVRLAKLQFSIDRSEAPDMWSIAGLIFDTATQPLAVGIRGGAVHARQVIYEAESLTVDMRFERRLPGNAISVAGQILDREAPLSWVSNAVIVLWTEKGRMVTRTEANECGEFQLEFEPQNQLRMSVITTGRKTLRIALESFD